MANIPAPSNAAVTFVNKILDMMIKNVAVDLIFAEGVALQPWLGLPIIGTLFKWILSSFAGSVYETARVVIDAKVIEAQSAARLAGYSQAVSDLKSALQNGDADEIKKASNADDDAFDKLIHQSR